MVATLALATPVAAETTSVVVRVLSQDGKFVGDHTGGARITLTDARTGKVLSRGVTSGGTGSTERIMDAAGRSRTIADDDAAAFRADLDIDEPTLVDLDVEGPLARPGSAIHVRSQRWIVPGEAIATGNGWMVELPGLAITPQSERKGDALTVTAKVELMCGCPITPGGRWDASDYSVKAMLLSGRRRLSVTPLTFKAAPGTYAGTVTMPNVRDVRLVVYAVNSKTGNSGLVETRVR
ncbi:hypothetical protein KZ813_16855 [Sphingomonas sp. RHCKR7]|uniref:hypothetical protein n=1 Tax=Sphingomonas folli TaxID=2862497 RepID=UPI001CA5C0D2|nr:hypothetical protein [Sphingomonas folli]MBW6528514.1 hypothetical protein [Sphingomonas folli]